MCLCPDCQEDEKKNGDPHHFIWSQLKTMTLCHTDLGYVFISTKSFWKLPHSNTHRQVSQVIWIQPSEKWRLVITSLPHPHWNTLLLIIRFHAQALRSHVHFLIQNESNLSLPKSQTFPTLFKTPEAQHKFLIGKLYEIKIQVATFECTMGQNKHSQVKIARRDWSSARQIAKPSAPQLTVEESIL